MLPYLLIIPMLHTTSLESMLHQNTRKLMLIIFLISVLYNRFSFNFLWRHIIITLLELVCLITKSICQYLLMINCEYPSKFFKCPIT